MKTAVYIIYDVGLERYKIGFSRRPGQRLVDLDQEQRRCYPIDGKVFCKGERLIMPAYWWYQSQREARDVEYYLHRVLKEYRVIIKRKGSLKQKTEWFDGEGIHYTMKPLISLLGNGLITPYPNQQN